MSRLPRTVNKKIPTSRASCSDGKKKRDPGFEAEIFSNLTIKATQAYVRKTNNALRYTSPMSIIIYSVPRVRSVGHVSH